MTSYHVDLHIDELVLNGLDGVDPADLGPTVERELARLFTVRGVPPALAQSNTVPHLDGGSFTVAPDAPPGAVGAQIAHAVYGGLQR